MFDFFSKRRKSGNRPAIASFFEAYKLGGMPLAVASLGALCMFIALGLLATKVEKPLLDPTILLLVGGVVVVFGGILWSFHFHLRTQFQIATLNFLSSITSQAAQVSKDGSNFKVALENFTTSFPALIKAITEPEMPEGPK